MARTYKRDSRGRFASGGGGGGSKKAAAPRTGPSKGAKLLAEYAGGRSSTKKANAAEHQRLSDMGVRAIGKRLTASAAKRFTGAKKTKMHNARSWQTAGKGFVRDMGAKYSSARVKSTVSRKR